MLVGILLLLIAAYYIHYFSSPLQSNQVATFQPLLDLPREETSLLGYVAHYIALSIPRYILFYIAFSFIISDTVTVIAW